MDFLSINSCLFGAVKEMRQGGLGITSLRAWGIYYWQVLLGKLTVNENKRGRLRRAVRK